MKRIISLSILFLLIFNCLGINKSDLISLNSYWEEHTLDQEFLNQLNRGNKYTPIQIHLLLVEKELRKNSNNEKKNKLIDVIHEYAIKGAFPINNHHKKRMPYFIDEYGTACAVGHLIIKSGNENLAKRISNESNYLYLREMDYPEITIWAKEFGFSIDELMWIQPSYGPSCAVGTKRDACFNSICGCINPDFYSIPAIAYAVSEYNDGNGWVVDSLHLWYNQDCARIGQHRITFFDSSNVSHIFTFQIGVKPQINSNIVNTNPTSTSNCDGSIIISNSPNLGYNYYLRLLNNTYSSSSNSGVFDSLCGGVYQLSVSDSDRYCINYYNFTLGFSTGIDEAELQEINAYPNPFTNSINIDFIGNSSLRLYNIQGRIVYESNHYNKAIINTGSFKSGVYILEVSNSSGTIRKKIIKSN